MTLTPRFADEEQPFFAQVTDLLRGLLGQGPVTQAHIARAIGISIRTLRRRLHAEGRVFEDLLDKVRRDLFSERMQSADAHSLTQIALALGYRHPSALTRSGHRWFGCAPKAWRADLEAGGAWRRGER